MRTRIASTISCSSVRPSPSTNAKPFQSSLWLFTCADTQICRTGAFGLTTNRSRGSSNSTVSAPAFMSTSKSYSSLAAASFRYRSSIASPAARENSCSLIISFSVAAAAAALSTRPARMEV